MSISATRSKAILRRAGDLEQSAISHAIASRISRTTARTVVARTTCVGFISASLPRRPCWGALWSELACRATLPDPGPATTRTASCAIYRTRPDYPRRVSHAELPVSLPGAARTLGAREGNNYMFCTFCGRNCVVDRVPFVLLNSPGEDGIRFACKCCISADCIHCKPIIIDCDTCYRPVARFLFGGGEITVVGGISPEGQLRGGGRTGSSPEWRARIWNVRFESSAAEDGIGSIARLKLVCVGKGQHRKTRVVTMDSLRAAYVYARHNNRTRITISDLRR